MKLHRPTVAEIDLQALAFNVNTLQKSFPPETFICPMVKANGYGHGDLIIAKALADLGIRHLGVSLVEEGVTLRAAGLQTGILVFLGSGRADVRQIIESKMTPVVSQWEQLHHLLEEANQEISIHLKFDTGMNRLGFQVSEATKLLEFFRTNSQIKVEALLSHLSRGEDADQAGGDSARQIAAFEKAREIFRPFTSAAHLLNSAGIVHRMALGERAALPLKNFGLRPGLMIYGYNPVRPGYGCELKPVMTLKSQVEVYHSLSAGQGVSYNSTWKASRDSVIAVVPIGYADGYHRSLSNKAHALLGGERVPVVGAICMDYLMLDVTDVVRGKSLVPKEEVVLFGHSKNGKFLGADELAKLVPTIPWEVLTSVGARVPKVVKGARG